MENRGGDKLFLLLLFYVLDLAGGFLLFLAYTYIFVCHVSNAAYRMYAAWHLAHYWNFLNLSFLIYNMGTLIAFYLLNCC